MFGSVCYHSSLSQELSRTLELQQRKCFAIILGPRYRSYQNSRIELDLPRLDTLRAEACLKWALKTQLNPQHADLFPVRQTHINTRHKKTFTEYLCHTTKYFDSAVPYMTRILNAHIGSRPEKISITTNSGDIINLL